jgi:hypothetical protein
MSDSYSVIYSGSTIALSIQLQKVSVGHLSHTSLDTHINPRGSQHLILH